MLYSNENGRIVCTGHMGSAGIAAYERNPGRKSYRTGLDRWELLDEEFNSEWHDIFGTFPKCEDC